MARDSKRLRKIHEDAIVEFDRVQLAVRDERQQARDDRRFVSIPGAMWEGKLGEQFENKPRYEVNKIQRSLNRLVSEYRNNRITVDFVSKDGTSNDDLADVCDGLFRADEQDSCAEEAYDNAFDEATSGGFGAWRLKACWEDEEDEEDERQRIRFEPIFDADTSVYFDLDAKRQDKSDAKRCWVVFSMTHADFEEEYGEDPSSWGKDESGEHFDWHTPDVVYLAEYYQVEETRETVRVFRTIDGDEERLVDPTEEEVAALVGAVELRSKTVKRRKVHKYLLSGARVLEDYGVIAGKHIPIVPVYGKRWFIDNVERFMGHVRLSKDPQRLKNMMVSRLAEISAISPVRKPIFAPEQIAGHENMWRDDNIENNAVLLVNPITNAEGQEVAQGPLGYTEPPNIPEALAGLLNLTEQDMAQIQGEDQRGEEMVSNISGKAVEMIQQRQDIHAFIYLSNFSKAMQRCGQIWLSMAKEIYHEESRKMKSIGEMDNIESVTLSEPAIGDEGGVTLKNDLSRADFDVVVDVGPSFSSRRQATVSALQNLVQFTEDPQDRKILQSLILMNTEAEGLADVQEYYRRQLVAMGVLQPNEEERAAMEAAGEAEPSAQDTYLFAEARKSEADAVKKAAETDYTIARTEREEAETIKTLEEAANVGRA